MRKSREICIVAAIILWFTALVFIFHGQSTIEVTNDERQAMNKALHEMTALQQQNQELHDIVISLKKLHLNDPSMEADEGKKLPQQLEACKAGGSCEKKQGEVTEEHEMLVRRSKNNLVEMWYAFERQLDEVKRKPNQIDSFKHSFAIQLQAAIIDVEDLHSLNNDWRKNESKALQDLTMARIRYLQNPKDCESAKKLVCNLNKACGFGCQLHHLAYCAMVAYGTERTLIVESSNWRYNNEGWEAVFLPASENCRKVTGSRDTWRGVEQSKNAQNVFLPIVDGVVKPPPFLPLGFPEDIGHRLIRLHGNPSVWWTGQFVHYLMRPQPWLEELLDATIKESGFQTPCLGIHVRRTDKVGTEAAFHSIEEYMKHVIAWYDKLDVRLSKEKPARKATRRVYLASDDSSVLPEARRKYPDYVFYGDTKIAESAGLGSRYSKNSLRGVLVDIFMLSKCDFLSCTFSSQVCRVAYELMQAILPDAADRYHSLDDIYYYGGQTGHVQKVVYPHQGTGKEISLEVGDVVGIAGNHWDGFSKGTNKRTKSVGLYPSWKVEEIFNLVKYPNFKEVEKKR